MGETGRKPLHYRVRRRALLEFTKVYEDAFDAFYGIRTYAPLLPGAPDPADRDQGYEPVSYRGLDVINRRVGLRADDVVYDLGCGMGRATCYFARSPIRGSIGVELDPRLAETAQRNAQTLRGRRAPIAIHQGDATQQPYGDGSLFFLFNPFSAAVLAPVLDRIAAARNGRPLRFIYVNPQAREVMDAAPWLKRSDWFSIPQHYVGAEVGVWETL